MLTFLTVGLLGREMETSAPTTQIWRFGVFEVDAHREEIRRAGVPIKLREQSFRILLLLLEHANELVTREELRKTLWPVDTYVDFEHSLNAAVMKLREALGDQADKPLYIETIPKRGYRFIAPLATATPNGAAASGVEQGASVPGEAGDPPISVEPAKAVESARAQNESRGHLRAWIAAGVLGALAVTGALVWYELRPLPQLRVTGYTRLTNAPGPKFPVGTDGHNLILTLENPDGGVATVPVSGGQLAPIPIDLAGAQEIREWPTSLSAVSRDGSSLLVRAHGDAVTGYDLWFVAVQGHPAHYLAKGVDATFSPDGKTIVYSTMPGELYTIPSAGGHSHMLLASQARSGGLIYLQGLKWSPDGNRIRFIRDGRYWEVSADGSDAHELLPSWHRGDPAYRMGYGFWTPDQDFFLFSAESTAFENDISTQSQIWAMDERRGHSHSSLSNPVQLTTGPAVWTNPVVSSDGKTLFAHGAVLRGELLIHDPKSKKFEPYLGGISAEFVDFSKDGKYLVYVTYPDGTMWRANRDGSALTQLTHPPMYPVSPRWSPDGSRIVFNDASVANPVLYTVSSQGGPPERLTSSDGEMEGDPNWSPDGRRIVYSQEFARSMNSSKPLTEVLDLSSGKTTALPACPEHFWSPRWSPNGRLIVGLAGGNSEDLGVLDLVTQKWTFFHPQMGSLNYPTFSHDSRFIYFVGSQLNTGATSNSEAAGVYRISVRGGKPELVADLTGFRRYGRFTIWMGLDPDDNPLWFCNAGADEVYALTLERK